MQTSKLVIKHKQKRKYAITNLDKEFLQQGVMGVLVKLLYYKGKNKLVKCPYYHKAAVYNLKTYAEVNLLDQMTEGVWILSGSFQSFSALLMCELERKERGESSFSKHVNT